MTLKPSIEPSVVHPRRSWSGSKGVSFSRLKRVIDSSVIAAESLSEWWDESGIVEIRSRGRGRRARGSGKGIRIARIGFPESEIRPGTEMRNTWIRLSWSIGIATEKIGMSLEVLLMVHVLPRVHKNPMLVLVVKR